MLCTRNYVVFPQDFQRPGVIRHNWVMIEEQGGLIDPLLALDNEEQPFPAKPHVRRMPKGIDKIANLQPPAINLAAVAPNLAVTPDARHIVNCIISPLAPQLVVPRIVRMTVNWFDFDLKISEQIVP